MYSRMILRDFSRSRVVTTLLVVLMTLAVVLATASAGTLVRLIGASGRLMTEAQAPDVLQMHAGTYDAQELERWVADRPEVVAHQAMLTLGIDGADLLFDGRPQTTSIQQNALVVPNTERDLLLGPEDDPITQVAPGEIVLPVIYEVEAGLRVGDTVTIAAPDGFTRELTVTQFARDSIMNPAIASSKRLAVSSADLEEVRQHTGGVEYLLEFWLDDESSTTAFEKAYLDAGMPQAGQMVDASTFRVLTMIGDGLVAAVVVLVSVLLLVVGLLCLRFALLTSTEEDHREIGVLKAIGVAPRDVRRIYLTKYSLLAGVAVVVGLLGGLALTPLLTRNITRYMGTAPSLANWVVPIVTAAALFTVLVLSVLLMLRRLGRISAVAALRSGAPGQHAGTGRLRLHRSRAPVHVALGAMDLLARPATYVVLFLVFATSAFVMIVPVNSSTTANAPEFINYMGIGAVDVRVDLRHSDASSAEQFSQIVDELGDDPDVSVLAPMVTTRNDTRDRDGNPASLYVENGDHTLLPVTYADGRAPMDETEIALSLLALHQAGREVGDTLPLVVGGRTHELAIVGSYQDITNGGRTAKSSLPTADDEVMWYVIGIDLAAGADATASVQRWAAGFTPAKVADIGEWRAQTVGPIARQMTVAAIVSAIVGVLLAMLMTGLFNRMLIARDKGRIAVQRALGAEDDGLRTQYLTRILVVLAFGVIAGTVAANTIGQTVFNLMFEAMFGGLETLGQGTSRIAFAVEPLLAYGLLPVALGVLVAAATVTSSRSIGAANISDLTME